MGKTSFIKNYACLRKWKCSKWKRLDKCRKSSTREIWQRKIKSLLGRKVIMRTASSAHVAKMTDLVRAKVSELDHLIDISIFYYHLFEYVIFMLWGQKEKTWGAFAKASIFCPRKQKEWEKGWFIWGEKCPFGQDRKNSSEQIGFKIWH